MTVSVVISAYNGESFIIEQLSSILSQTRKPDEVLIFDDCSSDNTVSIIKDFISLHELSNSWLLKVNEENKGWRRSFMEGFQKANGDIIFSCDQDDIWMPEKLQIMTELFETHQEISVLSSDYLPFYEGISNDVSRLHQNTHLGRIKKRKVLSKVPLDNIFIHTFIPGCTMAFKSSYFKSIRGLWYPGWAHDSLISTISKLQGKYYFINKPLIKYRRHRANNTPKNVKTIRGRIETSEFFLKRVVIIQEHSSALELSIEARQILQREADYCNRRILFFKNRNMSSLFKLLKYYNCYPSLVSFMGDILIAIKGK